MSDYPVTRLKGLTPSRNNSHHPDDVEAACDASMKDLNVTYLDLYLMHWVRDVIMLQMDLTDLLKAERIPAWRQTETDQGW